MYEIRTVRMIRQRGGITTAYLVFDASNRLIKSFHVKGKAEKFIASLQAVS